MIEYKYISFKLIDKLSKTTVWQVLNKNSGYVIGIIKWRSSWRQYCFFPYPSCLFSKGCLEDIIDFMEKIKNEKTTHLL
jgi:hypothetical protein